MKYSFYNVSSNAVIGTSVWNCFGPLTTESIKGFKSWKGLFFSFANNTNIVMLQCVCVCLHSWIFIT